MKTRSHSTYTYVFLSAWSLVWSVCGRSSLTLNIKGFFSFALTATKWCHLCYIIRSPRQTHACTLCHLYVHSLGQGMRTPHQTRTLPKFLCRGMPIGLFSDVRETSQINTRENQIVSVASTSPRYFHLSSITWKRRQKTGI